MDTQDYPTEHRNGQHLLAEERHEIEVRQKDGWSIYRIAKHLGRPYNTIKNEIGRGTVYLYNGKIARYKAKTGEQKYQENRHHSHRQYRRLEVSDCIKYVEDQFAEGGGCLRWRGAATWEVSPGSSCLHQDIVLLCGQRIA